MIGDIKGGPPAGAKGVEHDGGGAKSQILGVRPGLARIAAGAPYRAKADAEKMSANPHAPSTASHTLYNAGWDHAVHAEPRTAVNRTQPVFQQGVVNGLSWKRRNPVTF